ncbi:sensor histidine kinase [Aminobacter sp. HY435]|uniref:sensor histidine kinase n=1 Tax=Aminobacter sp. HY435 TaxID=2970917 RepID=UPI0022B9BE0C|nr:HWE histidine kinase domain-containing protein [Aminobacter sp. HY435]
MDDSEIAQNGQAGRPATPSRIEDAGHPATPVASDPDLDRLTALAASIAAAPIAILAVAPQAGQQSVKSAFGLDASETAAAAQLLGAILGDRPSPDGAAQDRLALVVSLPLALENDGGGVLLVLDRIPGPPPDERTSAQLRALADLAASLIALRHRSQAAAKAEAALVHAETRRTIALEAAALASWVWNPRTGVVECDALLPQLFNRGAATRMRARDIVAAIDPRDIGKTRKLFKQALDGNDDYSGEYRVRGSDPARWLAARGRVVERNADGKPTLVFGVNYDITERRGIEDRQRFLLRELNHRVKNTLSIVQALATQTVRHAREPREFLTAFTGRLRSLGLAHGLLSEHEWRGIGIRELAQTELAPFDEADARRISIVGQDALLTPDQALGLALVLHELASNALKYGSLSVSSGNVVVSWVIQGNRDDKRLVLDWTETGGPEVTPPKHHGFGSILIRRSLAKVISSEVRHEYLPEGVHARIAMPLGEAAEPV